MGTACSGPEVTSIPMEGTAMADCPVAGHGNATGVARGPRRRPAASSPSRRRPAAAAGAGQAASAANASTTTRRQQGHRESAPAPAATAVLRVGADRALAPTGPPGAALAARAASNPNGAAMIGGGSGGLNSSHRTRRGSSTPDAPSSPRSGRPRPCARGGPSICRRGRNPRVACAAAWTSTPAAIGPRGPWRR